jgi:hypothetical protein
MRRALWLAFAGAVVVLTIAAPVRADVYDAYSGLSARHLKPAPLVFTLVPPAFRQVDRAIDDEGALGRGGYLIRIVHYKHNLPDGVIALERNRFRTLAATLRDAKRTLGFRVARHMRVHAHRGLLLVRAGSHGTERDLLWAEAGAVYDIGSGTPRYVSLGQLRATANHLEHVVQDYIGSSADPNSGSEGYGVVTEHTLTLHVDFDATCTPPDLPMASYAGAGQTSVTLMRRTGNSFSWDIAQHHPSDQQWSGTVTGTIAPGAITVQLHATGAIRGDTCDSGPVSLTLDQRRRP